jgi:hypothetical protein
MTFRDFARSWVSCSAHSLVFPSAATLVARWNT